MSGRIAVDRAEIGLGGDLGDGEEVGFALRPDDVVPMRARAVIPPEARPGEVFVFHIRPARPHGERPRRRARPAGAVNPDTSWGPDGPGPGAGADKAAGSRSACCGCGLMPHASPPHQQPAPRRRKAIEYNRV